MRGDVDEMRGDMHEMRGDMDEIRGTVTRIELALDKKVERDEVEAIVARGIAR